jgi:hypothetical protein
LAIWNTVEGKGDGRKPALARGIGTGNKHYKGEFVKVTIIGNMMRARNQH